MKCVECGEELLAERAELGYRYCTRKQCQAKHHRGLTVTAVAVNKSADAFIIADEEELRRRGEDGEFGKKNADIGLHYRELGTRVPAPRRSEPSPSGPSPSEASPSEARPSGPSPSEPSRSEPRAPVPSPSVPSQSVPRRRATWTAAQEKLIRLYHDMGLRPAEIVQRAKENAPRLKITDRVVREVLSTLPRR